MAAKYLAGAPDRCQLCGQELDDKIYDARSRGTCGQWAYMCHWCFQQERGRLGTGLGQEYTKQPDGKWLKTGG